MIDYNKIKKNNFTHLQGTELITDTHGIKMIASLLLLDDWMHIMACACVLPYTMVKLNNKKKVKFLLSRV